MIDLGARLIHAGGQFSFMVSEELILAALFIRYRKHVRQQKCIL